MLKFITGNNWKFKEIRQLIAPVPVRQLRVELDEIQEIDAKKIIDHKLKQALKHSRGPLIVEDNSLVLKCLNDQLPGPLIRWFNDTVGEQGIYKLTKQMGESGATIKSLIGFAKNSKEVIYFEGEVKGTIVKPRQGKGFQYDFIFRPKKCRQTLSEQKAAKNYSFSPRAVAAKKLKSYLLKQYNGKP